MEYLQGMPIMLRFTVPDVDINADGIPIVIAEWGRFGEMSVRWENCPDDILGQEFVVRILWNPRTVYRTSVTLEGGRNSHGTE